MITSDLKILEMILEIGGRLLTAGAEILARVLRCPPPSLS